MNKQTIILVLVILTAAVAWKFIQEPLKSSKFSESHNSKYSQQELDEYDKRIEKRNKRIEASEGKKIEDMDSSERWGAAVKNLTLDKEIPCTRTRKTLGEC
ncbi:MAG: hypothetical protein MRY49_01700 [Candidatus Pacebacteria bacterium]|nr:hypothetical protein [Candidatus Paceibacterota bacterium]